MQKIKKKKNLSLYNIFLSFLIISIYTAYIIINIDLSKNFFVYFTFYLISIISLLVLCSGKNFISHIKIFFSFILIFFSLSPMFQYSDGKNLWNHISFNDSDFIVLNILIIVAISIILFVYYFPKQPKNKEKKIENKNCYCSNFVCFVFIIIDLLILLYEYLSGALITFDSYTSDTILSSFNKVVRFFPVATLILMIYTKIDKHKINNFLFIINILIALILFFPLSGSVSRFMLFGTYLIIAYELLKKFKCNYLLPLILIIGFTVVFPAFNFFKTHTIFELSEFKFLENNPFNTVDFDAYQMFLETIKYTKINGFTYGSNILSSLFFFIPRSIWNGKSLPSGELVSSFFGANFTNLSCPFLAEFYLSFGIIGILFGSFIVGLIINKMTNWDNSNNYLKKGISTIVFGMAIYILRGALLPTTAFSMALIISFIIAYTLCKTFANIKVR